jgi:hypothetical protein
MSMDVRLEGETPATAPRGAPVELIATVLLAVSTVVAVTVVSISSVHSWRSTGDSFPLSRVNT